LNSGLAQFVARIDEVTMEIYLGCQGVEHWREDPITSPSRYMDVTSPEYRAAVAG
jgi:hypothetical protein